MYSFSMTSAVRGFHMYKDMLQPTIDEVLLCERDVGTKHNTVYSCYQTEWQFSTFPDSCHRSVRFYSKRWEVVR